MSLKLVYGAIGKEYVIKHYSYGAIKTKFPDMSRIIASPQQRKCRDLFKEAVAYAKTLIADKYKKAEWKKRIKRKHRVLNAAIKEYMLQAKRRQEAGRIAVNILIHKAMHHPYGSMLSRPEIPVIPFCSQSFILLHPG